MYWIECLSQKWSDYLCTHGGKKQEREVYEYALICLLNEIVIDTILLLWAVIFGNVWEMILWIIVFDSLRMNIGGYHAKTPLICEISSILVGIMCVACAPYFVIGRLGVILVTAICLGITILFAPLINDKHPISHEKKNKAKIRGSLFVGIWGVTSLCLYFVWPYGSRVCLTGMLSAIVLLVIGVRK